MASIDKLDPLFGQAIFAVKRSFTKVPINPAFTVVIEFQTIDVSTSTHTPKACVPSSPVPLDRYECLNRIRYLWTTLPLFTPDGLLNAGLWKLPMFFPPTRPDISPAQISKLNCKPDSCAPSPVFVITTLVCYQSGTVEFLLPSQVSFRPPG